MQATQVLRDEHEGILAMLAVVEKAALRLRAGKEVPANLMLDAVSFFRNFADKCHHGKEEANLFPKLQERGIPNEGGPIGVMLMEHEQGRGFVRGMSQAADQYASGDKAAIPALVSNTLNYVSLLRAHIDKENNILFVMADQVLSTADQQALHAAFEEVERKVTGPGEHERYHAMIAAYQQIVAGWG